MGLFSRSRRTSFCAFCKSPRRLYRRKHVGLTNVLAAMVTALGISLLFYGEPDPRSLLHFSAFIIIAEMFIYLRWRAALTCRMCGFDPLVYKRSPARANRQVREFFEASGNDPKFMLSRSPLVDVHRRQREVERKRLAIEAVRNRARAKGADTVAPVVLDLAKNENTGHHPDVQRA